METRQEDLHSVYMRYSSDITASESQVHDHRKKQHILPLSGQCSEVQAHQSSLGYVQIWSY